MRRDTIGRQCLRKTSVSDKKAVAEQEDVWGRFRTGPADGQGPGDEWNQRWNGDAVDSLEFHWRTLVPFALELYFSSAGVPLENLSSTGAPGDAPGHGQAVPQPGACPGHQTHDETMSGKWTRREILFSSRPFTGWIHTWFDKVCVTFKQKLHPKIFIPTSSFRYNFEFNFGIILAFKFT